jgi:hypothetical protein
MPTCRHYISLTDEALGVLRTGDRGFGAESGLPMDQLSSKGVERGGRCGNLVGHVNQPKSPSRRKATRCARVDVCPYRWLY